MKVNRIKLLGYSGMIALLASMIVALLGYSNTTKYMNDIKDELLKEQVEESINLKMRYIDNSYGRLTQGNGTLLDRDGKSIENRFVVVDRILKELGDKATIFVKVGDDFKRISTNIMSDKNERALDTYLGKDHIAYDTVINGDLYIGEADILGESYYAAYEPVKDRNENVIGLLFVGTPTKKLDDIIKKNDKNITRMDISIVILRTISLGSLISLVTISVVDKNTRRANKNALKKDSDISNRSI